MVYEPFQGIWVSVISQKVAEKITHSIPSGTVTSIFDHSFNIETHDKFLINIGTRKFQRTPRSILLSNRDFLRISTKVRIGMTTLFFPGEIYFSELRVRLLTRDATIFDPKIKFARDWLPHSKIKRNLLEAADQLKSRRTMGMASPLSGYFISRSLWAGYPAGEEGNRERPYELEANNDLLQLRNLLWERIDAFLMHVGQRRLGDAVEQALSIVGLGFGLTPSGDDFLSGFLLAGIALNSRDQGTPPFLAKMAEEICRGAKGKTTSVSISMIEDASQGDFSEPAMNLFRSILQSEDPEQIRYCADQVCSLGATSGEDLLNGIMVGIRMFTGAFEGTWLS